MAKNNNKNKTTKHTIEFSNNTREQATLLLYSAAQGWSTHHRSIGPVRVVMSQLLYALDLRSETHQILHEQRVAAVDVKDVVHLGVTIGH